MAEKKQLTYVDLLNEKATFKASGTIVNITGEVNKTYKTGWTGSNAEITLSVNNVKQKIKIFGGTGKNEFDVKVYQLDGEGKIARDGEGKTISKKIPASQYNPQIHACFDKKEVIEWGERNAEGKTQKIEHIVELTDARFANALLANKDMLIGKRVGVSGNVKFKPTQKFDKIEANIELSQIVIQKVEEGKEYNDFFVIQSPLIIDKSVLKGIATNEGFVGYVPVYHKYITPIIRNNKEVVGRNVYVPFSLTVNSNGFLMLSDAVGYTLEDRQEMLIGKVETKTQGADLAIMTSILNYKSGMIEREITVEDLATDPVYGKFATRALNAPADQREEAIKKFKEMYKAQNPATVKGEFKQQIDFLTVNQTRDDGDKVYGIMKEAFEIYSLDKIKQESEMMESKKSGNNVNTQTNTFQQPKVQTQNTSSSPAPVAPPTDINDFGYDEFPF